MREVSETESLRSSSFLLSGAALFKFPKITISRITVLVVRKGEKSKNKSTESKPSSVRIEVFIRHFELHTHAGFCRKGLQLDQSNQRNNKALSSSHQCKKSLSSYGSNAHSVLS